MDQLDLIWDLESLYRSLKDIDIRIKKLKEKLDFECTNLLEEIEDLESINQEDKNRLNINRKRLKEVEETLNEKNLKLNEINKDLYGDNLKDLGQLEHLNTKEVHLRREINDYETELLQLLELLDNVSNRLNENIDKVKEIKEKIKQMKKSYKLTYEEYDKKNQKIMMEITEIKNNLNKSKLEKYLKIKKDKKTGVALAKNGVCSGCGMKISSALWDKLHYDSQFNYCETCGRILYINNK